MTTGDSIKREFDSGFAEPIPYFKRANATTGLWDHIFSHLQLKRRPTTSNPYAAGLQGFHTTFYDIRETKDIEVTEIWKHGPLYDHPLGWHFRKCAYTVGNLVEITLNQLTLCSSTALGNATMLETTTILWT